MLRRAITLPFVVLLLAGCGGGGSLSQEQLQKQLESVQSLAAEGALVADGAADGDTTETFVSVHSLYLSKAARTAESTLRSGDAPQEAIRLAARVADDLDRLHAEPDDPALARRIRDQLQRSAAQAEERAG